MIRILGSVLNVSFQTELLIMTLLGLANSTLDWKPLELLTQLNVIDKLHFPVRGDGEISGNFISWIKKLLTLTVVVQFFCSLLNPLAYLLKLYPIITWSRADILLPWLTIHALNTILPKLMSLVLAFVFYFESMISTISLFEFLLVETINLAVAWCNWYLFFDFYMDLRAIERKRHLIKQKEHKRLRESLRSSSMLSSSIPNLKHGIRRSSAELSELRTVRSLSGLTEHASRSINYNRNSLSSLSSDGALTPAEKTIKLLNLTDEELESARVLKGSLHQVLSNTNTADVELLDHIFPDEISYASVDNSTDSVIIVYDSQDEKELEKILSTTEENEYENHRKEMTSNIADIDLIREEKLLKVKEALPDEGMFMNLPQKEELLESRKSDSSLKEFEFDKEKLSEIEGSNLLEEESLNNEKRRSSLGGELFKSRKSDSLREQSLQEIGARDLFEEEKLPKIEKSNLLEEHRLTKNKKRYSYLHREEKLVETKKLEFPGDGKPFKHQKPGSFRSNDGFDQTCVCSSSASSDDDEDDEKTALGNVRSENFLEPLMIKVDTIRHNDSERKKYHYPERKKTKKKNMLTVDCPETPLLLSPSAALVPKERNRYGKNDKKDLNCLLNENFQLLDKMCRAMNFNNRSVPNNGLRKWLIFRHQLESSLDQNKFLKNNDSVIDLMKPRPIGYFNLKDKNTQTETTLRAKKRHRKKHGTLLHYPKTETIESKWNYLENFPGASTDMIGKSFPSHQADKSVEPSKIIDVSVDKIPQFINIVNLSKTTSTSRPPIDEQSTKLLKHPAIHNDRKKTNISILKTKGPVKYSEMDHFNRSNDKDLRNLRAYNKLTLEEDNYELTQKRKRSKMSSCKNITTDLSLRNSEVVPNRQIKVDKRTCKSDHSRTQNTARLTEPRKRNFKQLFRYNEKLFEQPAEAQGISKNRRSEVELCEDKTVLSAGTTVLSICHSDTELPDEGHHRRAVEDSRKIDWLNLPNDSTSQVKSPQVASPTTEEEPQRSTIVDDETVNMLKCAFSFSDESDRGFQLGPEMREPYPIFQVVALTMAEIFKATGWRNFEESLPENPIEAPITEVIYCEAELSNDVDDEVQMVNVIDELIKAEEEELERRKCLSMSLLEQLQDLLKSSRETLSEVENYRSRKDLDFFDDLCVKDGDIVNTVETCVYAINEQIYSNPLEQPKESIFIQNARYQESELPAETASQDEALRSGSHSRPSSASRNHRDATRTGKKIYRNRIHETKFENKVQKHHCRRGEGLSSGNVMEFDSEGRALNSSNCPSGEAISELDNESTNELVQTFNSFCDKFMENENVELEKHLKSLARSEKFQNFMSLFDNSDSKILREKIMNNEDEVVVSTSDFASGETVREVIVGRGKDAPPLSVDSKKENSSKLINQEHVNAVSTKNLDLPRPDVGIPYLEKLENHRKYLETDAIKQKILNWKNESIESFNSFEYPKKRKTEETRSFSDNSEMEEFSVN